MIRNIRQSLGSRIVSRSNAVQAPRAETGATPRLTTIAPPALKSDRLELSLTDVRPNNLINIRVDASTRGFQAVERADDMHNCAGTLMFAPPSPKAVAFEPEVVSRLTKRAASHGKLTKLPSEKHARTIEGLDLQVPQHALRSAALNASHDAYERKFHSTATAVVAGIRNERERAEAFGAISARLSNISASVVHHDLLMRAAQIRDQRARLNAFSYLAANLPPHTAARAHAQLRILSRGYRDSLYGAARYSMLANELPRGAEAEAHSALRHDAASIRNEDYKLAAIEQLAKHLPPGRASAVAHNDLATIAKSLADPISKAQAALTLSRTAP